MDIFRRNMGPARRAVLRSLIAAHLAHLRHLTQLRHAENTRSLVAGAEGWPADLSGGVVLDLPGTCPWGLGPPPPECSVPFPKFPSSQVPKFQSSHSTRRPSHSGAGVNASGASAAARSGSRQALNGPRVLVLEGRWERAARLSKVRPFSDPSPSKATRANHGSAMPEIETTPTMFAETTEISWT